LGIGCILSPVLILRLWLRIRESSLRESGKRREAVQAMEAGFRARQRSGGRRVRWLDEVEEGYELEKTINVRSEVQ
jgi:hypothetical protein